MYLDFEDGRVLAEAREAKDALNHGCWLRKQEGATRWWMLFATRQRWNTHQMSVRGRKAS